MEMNEHFFGLAHRSLPNFTYAELLKLNRRVMLRQQLAFTGKFGHKREHNSATGYQFMDAEDIQPLTADEACSSYVSVRKVDVDERLEIGYKEAKHSAANVLRMHVSKGFVKLLALGVFKPTKSDVGDLCKTTSDSDSEQGDSELDGISGHEEERESSDASLPLALTRTVSCFVTHQALLELMLFGFDSSHLFYKRRNPHLILAVKTPFARCLSPTY